ncbi:hypothetical protein AWB76_02999 [Caballeronia temeraria]|uniref:Uncharacterized protein n=1 Tax=Caballeronia temeraria TaxID=1777137 RepID=A0A158AT99_9BURK|nr:hypothetical protein AWB76_02999 [Caballeronia temeraria]
MQWTTSASQRSAVRLLGATSLAAALVLSASCAAQTDAIAPSAPPPVSADAPPPPPPPILPSATAVAPPPPVPCARPIAGAVSIATMQATVSRFLTNPDGDVDGFLTIDGRLVRFPPHMGTQLTATVRQGDNVQLSGWHGASSDIVRFAGQPHSDLRPRAARTLIERDPNQAWLTMKIGKHSRTSTLTMEHSSC